jgi:asparagine synthase (glutamine-hydrolysing)
MLDTLSHRGPDARGVMTFPGCHLGHTRLNIIDLNTGSQPMTDASGRLAITFNGEIYNYRELRSQLEKKGHLFKTRSDTEVILVSYMEWGAECVNYFRGMFAFAIWDISERRMFAARDLFGEKPLYFTQTDDGSLLLASEIKALTASGTLKPVLDYQAVDAYLTLGYVPPHMTIFSNVSTLPPGHFLQWDSAGARITRYWEPGLKTQKITFNEAEEKLGHLFKQAVRRQMVADVPVGAFLSGGLDSSTITALMQMESDRPVKTFSVGFGEYGNELPYAGAVAKMYKTEHHEIDLGMPRVAEMLERMVAVYDEPFADTSNIPTYMISEFARKHVKVVLSGDGGDELFGGYWWYPPLAMSEKEGGSYFRWLLLRMADRAQRGRNSMTRTRAIGAGLSARWPDMWTRDVMLQVQFRSGEREKLWGTNPGKPGMFDPGGCYKPSVETTGMNRGFYFDLTCFLPGDILVKVDRAAMAHALETRAPFLDRDLAEFALSLPPDMKVDGIETKILMKSVCSKFWPPELRSRGKQGFGSPINIWLDMPDVQSLINRVFRKKSALYNLLPGITEKTRQGKNYKTWMLLTLGLWLEQKNINI